MKRILLVGLSITAVVAILSGCSGQGGRLEKAELATKSGPKAGEFLTGSQFREDMATANILFTMGCRARLNLPNIPTADYDAHTYQVLGDCIDERSILMGNEIHDRIAQNLLKEDQAGGFLIEEAVRFAQLNDERANSLPAEVVEEAARHEALRVLPQMPK